MASNHQFYKNLSGYFSQIQSEHKAGRKDLLAKTVQKMAKQVNQRFYRLEKAGIGLGENAYRYAQKETGKDKPRYTESLNKLKGMSREDLYELALQINKKLVTPSTTIGGTRALYEKRLELASKKLASKKINVSKDQLLAFIDAGGDEFLNNAERFSSNQIMIDYEEYVLNGKVTTDQFVRGLKQFQDITSMKYSDIQKSFRTLMRRNKKRK